MRIMAWFIIVSLSLMAGLVPGVGATAGIERVEVVRGGGKPAAVAIAGDAPITVRLGRAEDNTIVFSDRTVSRKHAEIVCERGNCRVIDIGTQGGGSMNGTFLNGHRLEPGKATPLGKGNRLMLGPEVELLVR